MTTNVELCETLEAQLVRMDKRINIRKPSIYFNNPSEFLTKTNHIPPNHIVWAVIIEWPIDEVITCKNTGFDIHTTPHNVMWAKFKTDFPPVYQSYRTLVREGLFRTGTKVSEEKQTVNVMYYKYIDKTRLRGADRDEMVQ